MLIIKTQGKPKVNTITVIEESDSITIYEVDLNKKYCDIVASSGNSVFIETTGYTPRNEDESENDFHMMTVLEEDKPDFEFFTGSVSRYTARLVFVKRKRYEDRMDGQFTTWSETE